MTERLKWPCLAVLLGILGALLRRWQMLTAFEDGLCDPAAPACMAMIAFAVLAAAVLLMNALSAPARTWREKDPRLSLWDQVFAAKGDTVFLLLMALAGVLTAAAVPFLLRDAVAMQSVRRATGEGDSPMLQLILALCAIPGGAGYLLNARSAAAMTGEARKNGMLLFPGLFSSVWLLESYRANAADPALWDYAPLLFAVMLGLLLQLECAALAFGGGRPRRVLWLAGMTFAVSLSVIGGGPNRPDLLMLGGQSFGALAVLWIAPGRLSRPPRRDRFSLRERAPDMADGIPDERETESGEDPVFEDRMEDITDGQ